MRVLLVTIRLALPGGSELYVRDVARALRARGHVPIVCSAHLGPVADELRASGIPIVDDPARLAEAPDVIHGQHHLATMAALARFPTTPTVYFCHGFLPWEEAPPPAHPAIRRWVAVSDLTRERLVTESGVSPERIDVIPNFVDLSRFQPRGPLPARPRHALLLSNSAPSDGWVDDLRRVCADRGIVLDQLGLTCGRPVLDLEQRLPAYDLVFARGRSALEAMAVGAAVVLCDVEGSGGLVDVAAFAGLQRGNFGLQVLEPTHDPARLAHAIDRYDPVEATRVRALVRERAALEPAVDRIVDVYARAIADAGAAPSSPAAAQAVVATYLRWVNATMPSPRLEEREAVLAARHAATATVAAAEARSRDTIAAADREAARALEAERERAAAITRELAASRAETADVREELTRLTSGRAVRVLLPMLWRARRALLPQHSVRLRIVRRLLGRVPAAPAAAAPDAIGDGRDLSVVVLALGAPSTLVDAVRSLREQQPMPEIVVVASGDGSDGVGRLLRDAGLDVPVVSTSRRLLPGAARNVGIAAARGRWIAFLAADCIAAPGWVGGRLEAHRAGADVVASAVVPPRRWNPWSSATQVLLFAARMPGTPPPERRLYGASYARTLFTRHGRFRPDLRAGEDSELHQRLVAGGATFVFRGDVRSIHRHPTGPAPFLRDHYRRGHRMVGVHAALGAATRGRVAANALERVLASFRTTARATPARDWLPLVWSAPWLLPGATAYALGALSARPAREPDAPPPPPRRLVCLLQCHDERRFLPEFLDTVAPHVDGILALDDGSSDGSDTLLERHPGVVEVLRIAPRTPHAWDEPRNKRLLLDAAARHGAEWVIALDADERIERDFRARADAIIDAADRARHLAFAVHIRELWNSPERYRSDGIWGLKRSPRLFRLLADHDPGDAELHGPWAPNQGRGPDGAFRIADLIVYHARMIDPADRAARRRRYETLDPDCRWQSVGYAYLTDETGMVLEDCPAHRAPESPGDR